MLVFLPNFVNPGEDKCRAAPPLVFPTDKELP